MRIYENPYKQKIEVVIEHQGQKLAFLANVFGRKALCESSFDVFEQINEYWAAMPLQKQNQVFEVYQEVERAFDLIGDTDAVYTILNNCIKRLLELHPLSQLEFWLSVNPKIFVPETVKDLPPDPTENLFTSERTYTRKDYFPLLALSMFLRTVLPIWGQYIESIRRSSEMNRKEFIALQLLIGTGVLECEAMQRLRVYINASANPDDIDHARTLEGFSTEDVPFLFQALVTVRRICLADLRGVDNRTQIVATLFKFMAPKAFSQADSNITIKKEDKRNSAGGTDTGKHSILETYRKRTEISFSEVAEFEYAVEDYIGIAQRLEPTLTEDEINYSVDSILKYRNGPITDVQLVIASWMIKDQISPHALYYIENTGADWPTIKLLGALEAVLWKWGYRYLAALITAHAVVDVEEVTIGNISSREQLDPELVEQMRRYYPFEWRVVRKGIDTPQPHPNILAIDLIVDNLTFGAYRSTMHEDRLREVFGEVRRKVAVFSDIKNILARFLIELEARKMSLAA